MCSLACRLFHHILFLHMYLFCTQSGRLLRRSRRGVLHSLSCLCVFLSFTCAGYNIVAGGEFRQGFAHAEGRSRERRVPVTWGLSRGQYQCRPYSERTPVVADCRSHQVYANVPLSPPPFVGFGRLLVPVIARHEDTCGTMHSSRAIYVVLQTNVLQTFARCRCCCQSASCPMVNQSAEHRQTDSSEPAKLGPKRPSPAGARRTNGAFQDQPCLNTRGWSAQLARI